MVKGGVSDVATVSASLVLCTSGADLGSMYSFNEVVNVNKVEAFSTGEFVFVNKFVIGS